MKNYIKIFFWYFIGIFGALNFSLVAIFLLMPAFVWLKTGIFVFNWGHIDYDDLCRRELAFVIISTVVGLVLTANSIRRFF